VVGDVSPAELARLLDAFCGSLQASEPPEVPA
jgi:predicted Zn-dependent peptidase